MNAVEIEEAISLLAEQSFVPTEFPYSFLEAFGNKETTLKRLKTGNNNRSNVDGGVLQQNNIHIAVCDESKVYETLQLLKNSPATSKGKVKFILATDGKEFQAEDINSGETVSCEYQAFHNYFGFFLPLAGISTVKQIRENAFDIKATSRLNKLYIELLRHNPDWATPDRRHDMNHFLARLIFCFFAEDTDIFQGDGLFTETVQKMSDRDASDTHEIISEIFRSMDVKQHERVEKGIKNWATAFPYVNGQLFSGSTETPKFTKIARSYLFHVGSLDWKKINPDIFGSMIQAVADVDERESLGMHYTSVPNILKVLNPLFLDGIKSQLQEADNNVRRLINLRKRISRIRIFDPACGSGNFLVIAYKQLREIEFEINKRCGKSNIPSEIPLTNFRGIELRDFSAEVARLALIIAEYQCDVLYRGQQLALAEFLPLNAENWITQGNALEINWLSVCPPNGTTVKIFGDNLFAVPLDQSEIAFANDGGEIYICGNPPYIGGKKLSDEQKLHMKACGLSDLMQLDYVCCWFFKFIEYEKQSKALAAFVTTSSICQGEQVALLWSHIFANDLEIFFAYEPFKWSNNASHNAGVVCTVLGIGHKSTIKKRIIFSSNSKKIAKNINPYIIDFPNILISSTQSPINGLPDMCMGSNPVDGKHLVLTTDEARLVISQNPYAEKFLKRYLGGNDVINNTFRYCIWIEDGDVNDANKIPFIKDRLEKCKEYRQGAGRDAKKVADQPHRFCYRTYRNSLAIALPKTSSSNRSYVPASLVESGNIINVDAFAIYYSDLFVFSIISSKMHNVWLATTSGRLGEGYRYSVKLSYNTFPMPLLTEKNKNDLTKCAEEILIARERHFPKTIANLYDPENMPEDLQRAHERNDEVLERIYIGRRFKNDTERLEKLFELYTQMISKRNTL